MSLPSGWGCKGTQFFEMRKKKSQKEMKFTNNADYFSEVAFLIYICRVKISDFFICHKTYL